MDSEGATSEPKEVLELVSRYPRASRLLALIKKVDDGSGKAPTSADLLSAYAALASDLLRAPLREVILLNNGGAATPGGAPGPGVADAATAAEAEAQHAAFSRSLAVIEGVTLQAPRSGKADLGFGADCLRVRSAKGPMLTIAYPDIEHIVIMDKIPQQPDDRNGIMLALRRGATIGGAPPPPASATAAAQAPPDALVMQLRAAPVLLRAPEVARHVGEWLQGPPAVVLCQLMGCLLPEVCETTFLAVDPATGGFRSSRGAGAVSANIKASSGWLFPLKTGFAYIGKPACFLRLGDIADVDYGRAEGGSSTFDLILRVDDGGRGGGGGGGVAGGGAAAGGAAGTPAPSQGRLVELAQIDASELPKLKAYFAEHKAAVGALRRQRAQQLQAAGGGAGVWGSAVAQKKSSGGAGGSGPGKADKAEEEEEDEDEGSDEDDEDFNPGASSSEEEEGGRRGKKGGGKRVTRGHAASGRGDSEEDGGGEAGPSAGVKRARAAAAEADEEEEEEIGSEDSSEDEEEDEDDEEEDEDEDDESLVPSDELSE